jgi:RNA polymerase sigma factor (sigma-70 family)
MTPATPVSDLDLLHAYVHGSQSAFAELVGRHINLVYSAAFRQVRDRHLAEDISQAVFLVLSQKAPKLGPGVILPAWLHRAGLFCAANAIKARANRLRFERSAAQMANHAFPPSDEPIEQAEIIASLDQAIGKLSGIDRSLVVLRFFQDKTHAQAAAELGISPLAANKRFQRAILKLRRILARLGHPTAAVALTGNTLTGLTRAAPAHLAASICSSIAVPTAAAAGSVSIASGAIRAMFWSHIKSITVFAATSIVTLVAITTAVLAAQNAGNPAPPPAALPAASAVLPPAPPSEVAITVLDSISGKPLADATVTRLKPGAMVQPWEMEMVPSSASQTDADGQVHVTCDPAARTVFVVTAAGRWPKPFAFWGCIPPAYSVTVGTSGPTLRGITLDEAGHPIADAPVRVRVCDYQLAQPLNGLAIAPRSLDYWLEGHTDSSGRFVIASADGNADCVEIQQSGQWRQESEPIWASQTTGLDESLSDGSFVGRPVETPAVAAMKPAAALPPVTLHLRVLDAQTNQPIARVRVSPGGSMAANQPLQTREASELELPGGDVRWSFYDGAWEYFLRVSADGYASAPTRIVKASEQSAELELKLSPATEAAVMVLTPSGRPAAGARAYLSTPTMDLNVPMGIPSWDDDRPIGVAGDDGVIHFSPPDETYRLAISQAEGSAVIMSDDIGQPVVLEPWASMDIKTGAAVTASDHGWLELQCEIDKKQGCSIDWVGYYIPDSAGQTVIPALRASQHLDLWLSAPASAVGHNWTSVDAHLAMKPGEHADWSFMTGTTTLRAELMQPAACAWGDLNVQLVGPPAALPSDLNRLEKRARRSAVQVAVRAADKSVAINHHFGEVGLRAGNDGTIALSGLSAGTYELTGYATPIGSIAGSGPTLGQAVRPPYLDWFFSIPASQPPEVNLGAIAATDWATPAAVLKLGDLAPELNMNDLYGVPFSLADLRGKWVLLDFWGTWCGFCIAEEPVLKDAFEGWGSDGRLVMVSASVDDTPEEVSAHVTAAKIAWKQLVLGPHEKTTVPDRFSVNGYPTIMLISPAGTLVESGLRGERVRDALIRHIGPPSPPPGP